MKKNNKDIIESLALISILPLAGILVIYITWDNYSFDYNGLYRYMWKHGFEGLVSLFFISIGVYGWIKIFINRVLLSKKECLYLARIDDKNKSYVFLNFKGKKFEFPISKYKNLELKKFYDVMKTKDEIEEIIGESIQKFEVVREKLSYWLNLYTVFENFEDVSLLPIVYVIFIPGFLSFLMLPNIWSVIFMTVPAFIIIYDAIYKIKKVKSMRKNFENNIDNEPDKLNYELVKMKKNTEDILEIIFKFLPIIEALIFNGACVFIFIKSVDLIGKVAIIPFFICGVAVFLSHLFDFISLFGNANKKINLFNIFSKMYVFGFLLFWFGFLIFSTYFLIKDGKLLEALFLLPFWGVGILIIFKSKKFKL